MDARTALLASCAFLAAACGNDATTNPSSARDAATGEDAAGASGGAASGGMGAAGGTSGGTAGTAGSSADAGAGGWTPDPIPTLDPEPPVACSAATTGDYFQFLDDVCHAKAYPTFADRDLACPVLDETADGYVPAGTAVSFDSSALVNVVPDSLDVAVVLIKRVGGVPHLRVLSNGNESKIVQPWSTSKFLAAANAASYLRVQSNYSVGLTASTGGVLLGDLVTSLCNYDYSPYGSNSLGRYFHDIGGRKRANDLIHDLWLNRPAGESFGGNYGEPSPGLGYAFSETNGASITIQPDTSGGYTNALSMGTLAFALTNLVLHREVATTRLPGIQWADVSTLLYGAQGSAKYGEFGGMSQDTAVYLQAGHDIDYIEQRSHGRWRIFSKLGLGTAGQFANVGYACFPVLDPSGAPVPGWGREFVIASHLPTGGSNWRERDRLLAKYYRAIVTRIVDGQW